ncbi:hypothetical protein V1514DRAFT_338766 [Lipomyces japonicus]|uniref:uncharacterized protein n=1 Tax=Lipomyces japonicus TaxID=56871 RepID=UPI0034CD9967
MTDATTYDSEYSWHDVTPIPQHDGTNPALSLSVIAYQPAYVTAMGYLRAVMRANELSDRALKLTEDVILMNPAHYTIWSYRARILLKLKTRQELEQELVWIEQVAGKFPKNYQIWNHREVIVDKFNDGDRELKFINQVLLKDSKNYHAWSYRQWVVRRFNLWAGEIEFTTDLILHDVRNNSAWNHRFFALFGNNNNASTDVDDEIEFGKSQILIAENNQSSWNYLLGVLNRTGRSIITELEQFCLTNFINFKQDDDDDDEQDRIISTVTSAPALEVLGDIYASRNELQQAKKAWELLANKYDTIRDNYWNFKINQASA